MILLYITGQWGQDLPSKYSPLVSLNVCEEIKDRSCLDKREIFLCVVWLFSLQE